MLCVAVFVFPYSSRPFGGGSEAPHLKAAMKCHLCQLPAGLWGQGWVCWAAQCRAGTGTHRDTVPKEPQWLRPALTINSLGFGVTLGSVLPGTAHPTPAFGALQDTQTLGHDGCTPPLLPHMGTWQKMNISAQKIKICNGKAFLAAALLGADASKAAANGSHSLELSRSFSRQCFDKC